jgi:hypothetical protein
VRPEVFHDQSQADVPDADCQGPPSIDTDTELLADDDPETVTTPETVVPVVGVAILTEKELAELPHV